MTDQYGRSVCKRCKGIGAISLTPAELPIESGVFCGECETGKQKWKQVKELIDELETARLTTVFVPRRRPDPAQGHTS